MFVSLRIEAGLVVFGKTFKILIRSSIQKAFKILQNNFQEHKKSKKIKTNFTNLTKNKIENLHAKFNQ